jgi:RimJ/RimL family protein N-acetyltransferase
MIAEATAEDLAALIAGEGPRGLLLPDPPIAPPEILRMLGDVAAQVRATFVPASWLIVEGDLLVGLVSITRPPSGGAIDIGYGVAPGHWGRGIAGRAVGEIVAWASRHPAVAALTAETAVANVASQRVLARNGFQPVGGRHDEEDGALVCWHRSTG